MMFAEKIYSSNGAYLSGGGRRSVLEYRCSRGRQGHLLLSLSVCGPGEQTWESWTSL